MKSFSQQFGGIALLITPEYEGIFRNGGIGTYYRTLSQNLSKAGLYVILLVCRSEKVFGGVSSIPELQHVFSIGECETVLELLSVQTTILRQLQTWQWIEYESYCSLFFVQAIAYAFPNTYLYIEFPEMLGIGYRTIQAKRSGVLSKNCTVAVTLHSSQEWLQEAHAIHAQHSPKWFLQVSHYEQYSFEQADLAFFLSFFLKEKVEQYGWKTAHAIHLPYCFQVINSLPELDPDKSNFLTIDKTAIPLVFFGRLEERKGLLTFLKALEMLDLNIRNKIHVLFLGKSTPLQVEESQGVESKTYIQKTLEHTCRYNILTDLFSQEAIQLVKQLRCPVACLTSPQENFPNTALEMGQLPNSLVVADTGGFREPLQLIQRTEGLYWFLPGEARSLAQAIAQAISNYPEQLAVPAKEELQAVNHRLLAQRLKYMEEALGGSILPMPHCEENKPRSWILGMTSMEEQLFLEDYAQNQYTGQGEIVELGCWFGSSTISLAMGLEKNTCIKNKVQRIHAYDIFVWHSAMERSVSEPSLKNKYKDGDIFLSEYLERIDPWKNLVKVYPGDLTEMGWKQAKIECLFIDAMKSWNLTSSIAENFFPYLIPGLSLIVHQDFAHYYTAWIHLLMYRLRQYMTPIEHSFIYSSRVFRADKSIPEEALQAACSFDDFTEAEVEAAFAYSLNITDKRVQPNIWAAKVMYFIHIRNFARAKAEFRRAVANLERSEWLELVDLQETVGKHFGVELSN